MSHPAIPKILAVVDDLHRASDIAVKEGMSESAVKLIAEAKGMLAAVRILDETEAAKPVGTEVEQLVKGGAR